MTTPKINIVSIITVAAILILFAVPVSSREEEQSSNSSSHSVFVAMLIEHEPNLQEVGEALASVLKVRLGKYGVEITKRPIMAKSDPSIKFAWVVTLRRISERHLIVTIDSADDSKSVSEVRTVSWQAETEQLAWTMALVVEETVTPYLESEGELPALGAGLAILEPEEVGGTKKKSKSRNVTYPRFFSLGMGLAVASVWSVNEVLTGPRLSIKGIFSRNTVAAFSLGWQGSAHYSAEKVSGTFSQIPIELYVGHVFLRQRVFRLVGWVGFSLGFAVYKSQRLESPRTDMTFQPGGNLMLEMDVRIVSLLEFFLQGGCNFPFVRDVLVNNGVEVYSHVWVMPVAIVGLQLVF
ncbi:MAG: hypothetical protein JXR76_12680 [Deltaproteobacteria bacterium]|nr:hypothetical protein [Deltaproteobacteria bacterium]